MADLLMYLVLGGVAFFVVKWLIFRKPFPYLNRPGIAGGSNS